MKSAKNGEHSPWNFIAVLARALLVAGFLLGAGGGWAQSNPPLNSWSFRDSTNWTSDSGQAPVSFTNLDYSHLGNGASLVVSSTNPAWLQYNVAETDGATNLTVDAGTVMFWFAPRWSSTNAGGAGPGEYGRLIEVGGYTPDASFGWWSLYVDDVGEHIYFSAQTNDLSSNVVTYLSVPVAWTTNYFHLVALTYSATNSALYLDGALATNGPPLTTCPGADVLADGFYIGSDRNGRLQARGMFNSVATYRVPLDADKIRQIFDRQYACYILSPLNPAMYQITSGSSSSANLSHPSSSPSYFNIISGAGCLQSLGGVGNCTTSSNVWMTNVSASAVSQPMSFNFDIAGGYYGGFYDVFASSVLGGPVTWTWMGQGMICSRYFIPSLPMSDAVFFILGTPLDSDGDGLTDAYERLVSHSNPYVVDTDLSGMPDGWQALHFNGLIHNNPTLDPDLDGLTNLKEYLYGTDPQVSEGFAVWVSSPN